MKKALAVILVIASAEAFSQVSEREKTIIMEEGPQKPENLNLKITNISPIITEDGILFYYISDTANSVKLAGDFTDWKPTLKFTKHQGGIWLLLFTGPIKKGTYKYKLVVDGIWIEDPLNTNKQPDGLGEWLSILNVPYDIVQIHRNPVPLGNGYYLFRYEAPKAKNVYLTGTFNNWNLYSIRMKKGDDGVWQVKLKLPPKEYIYAFIVDGVWKPDPLNRNMYSDLFGHIVNIFKAEENWLEKYKRFNILPLKDKTSPR